MGALAYCNRRRKLYVMTNTFLISVHVEVDNEDISMDKFEFLQNDLKSLRLLETRYTSSQNGQVNEQPLSEMSEEEPDRDEGIGDSIKSIEDSNVTLCHFGLVVLNENLYLIGGADVKSQTEHSLRSSVFMFDVDEKKWHQKADMSQSRACLTTVVLDEDIYAIGEYNRFRLKTAERYDVTTNTWQRIADMEKFRSHTTSLAVANKIMVLGRKSYAHGCEGQEKFLT